MTELVAPELRSQKPSVALPIDALAKIFLALGRHYNTNSNQILVIQGDLDLQRLKTAVHAAVQRFQHVLVRLDSPGEYWCPEAVQVREIFYSCSCGLQNGTFREFLMSLSEQHRIDWRTQAATQVFLVRSADKQTCCVYLNSAHAAADAASDCMLLGEIIEQYGGRAVRSDPVPNYEPLHRFAPGWFGWRARIGRLARAWLDIAAANLSQDLRLKVRRASRWGYAPSEVRSGFFTSTLPARQMEAVRQVAKKHGVRVNSVFSAALARTLECGAAVESGRATRFSIAVSLRNIPSRDPVSRAHAFGNHIITCTVRQRPGLAATDLVKRMHEAVANVCGQRLQVELGRFELALPFMAIDVLQPLVRRAMGRAQATNVCYSNPGILQQDFSGFGSSAHPVLEYTGLGCLVSPYDIMLYTTTVNGRTQLDALYRQECFEDFEAELIEPLRNQLNLLIDELLCHETISRPLGQEEFA
jgi:NRPS condensation-like uncharacterized protein